MPAGNLFPSPEFAKATGSVAIEAPRELSPWGGFAMSVSLSGARTDTQPVNEPGDAKAGSDQPMFGFADWYNRIHITPGAIDLGNVVGQQTANVVIWNAYTTPKTLASIQDTNAEGITLTEPAATPLVYQPLRERTYTVVVGTDGPATIGATYLFDFIDANEPQLAIAGTRIIAWTWAPNWGEPMIERLDWLTDVLTAHDGTEQRIRLREYPRRALEFSFGAQGAQRRRLDVALYGWGARLWALPIWTDGQRLAADLLVDDLVVPVTTTDRDFTAGGLVMLLGEDGGNEVVEIDSVEPGALNLVRPLLNAWPAGSCTIYPARPARLPASHGFRRFTGDFVTGRVRMEVEDVNAWPAATETTYRGLPVLTTPPNWIGEIDQDLQRKLAQLDYGTGLRAFDDESGKPEIVQSYRWMLDGRDEIAAFRSWLYSRAGKFAACWVPTWVDDLVVVANIGAAATAITIENIGYTLQAAARVHRRDLRIELTSGAVYYRRITGSSEAGDTEVLNIDTALGVLVTPTQIARVSFMALARLDADGVEINWFTGDTAEAAHNMRATGNVV